MTSVPTRRGGGELIRHKIPGPGGPEWGPGPGGQEWGPGPGYIAYVFVFLDGIICRLYKLTFSHQAQVPLQLRDFPN